MTDFSPSRYTDYDVIIAGGGPAGSSTAIHLAGLDPQLVKRTLILEKEIHPREKLCGGGINSHTMDWIVRHGVELAAAPSRVSNLVINIDGNIPDGKVVISPADFYTLSRKELDGALFRRARELGVETAEREPLLSWQADEDRVLVKTPKRDITAAVLVGADGANSIVRSLLPREDKVQEPPHRISTLSASGVLVEDTHSLVSDNEAIIDFHIALENGVRGYAWSFPSGRPGSRAVNVGTLSYRVTEQSATLRELLKRFTSDRGITVQEQTLRAHPILCFDSFAPQSGNRTVLAGDAAGIDPLLGEGISFALGYGEVAADAIFEAFHTGDMSFVSYRERLMGHGMGRSLANLAHAADKVYCAPSVEEAKVTLMSIFQEIRVLLDKPYLVAPCQRRSDIGTGGKETVQRPMSKGKGP